MGMSRHAFTLTTPRIEALRLGLKPTGTVVTSVVANYLVQHGLSRRIPGHRWGAIVTTIDGREALGMAEAT